MPIIKPGEVFDGHTGQTNNVRGRIYSPALPTTYTITSEAFSAIAGGTAIVDWTAPVGHSASDTVLVSPVGGTSFTPTLINETALNGRTNVILPTPTELYELPDKDATQFEFEYWADGAGSPTATSSAFTLTFPVLDYSATTLETQVIRGANATFEWTQPWGNSTTIGLFVVGAALTDNLGDTFGVNGYGSGTDTITVPVETAPGTICEFRLFSNLKGRHLRATSTSFEIIDTIPD